MRATAVTLTFLTIAAFIQAAPTRFLPDTIPTENDASQSLTVARRNFDTAGNGITFPLSNQPLSIGQSYVFRFMTGANVNIQWDTITVDLYLMEKQQYFIQTLVQIDPSEVFDPLNPYTGNIPVTIPTTVGTGPLYVVKIYGINKITNTTFLLPDSSYFPIVNPYGGSWNHPSSSDIWYTGRTTVINFVLGSAFSRANTMRLEAGADVLGRLFTIIPSIPITPSMTFGAPSTLSFNVPITFNLSQAFYVRLAPNDGIYATTLNSSSGALSNGFSLPSAIFTIFPSYVLSNYNVQINITTPSQPNVPKTYTPLTSYVSSPITFSWRYNQKPGVSNWNIDLYSAGDSSQLYMGARILSASSLTTFTWTPDTTIPAGMYYVRIWGFADGAVVSDQVDPISSISGVFMIVNPVLSPILRLTALAASGWSAGCLANVTWNVTQIAGGTNVLGWIVDLYQQSYSSKFITTLTPTPLSSNLSWALVNVPVDNVKVASDYFVRVRAVLDQSLYPGQDIGNITYTTFSIGPAPPVSKRNQTIANFSKPKPIQTANNQASATYDVFPTSSAKSFDMWIAIAGVAIVFVVAL
ncbi:hypothetical protein BCR33DRAFT_715240 [Rhizoclosmatium globosum]|uniref:Fibronectin type-III domain-containing protein n=1 Tax=Rhizoclosmatium globosum TaxID=329046 RepID=A0A1Y2CIG8_9FUNG|nr:hypothetical protein BCR33DRAFT_715240 [Rhizoclosmatium globosum]|eukprot:ORY46812.1 hypothetical protein BCR33DRAFT_715240 [Rhizoclosmatium globosum]